MARPGVVTWFIAYCVLMAIIYGLLAVVCILMLSSLDTFEVATREGVQRDPESLRLRAVAMAVIGVPLMILFAIAPILPRQPWVWIYDIVLICIGLTSCCFWPINIPLLIFWIKPDTRAWFGRRV